MHICRILMMVILPGLWVGISVLPAWGDVYKCPDGQGKVHFQNTPCTGSDETPVVIHQPMPPPPIAVPLPPPPLPDEELEPKQTVKNCLLIAKIDDKLLDQNRVYAEVAWKVEVSNRCGRAFRIQVVLSLLDRQDFALDEGRASIVVPSMGEGVARGRLLVSPAEKMRKVDRVHARIAEY